jgi:GntR family transcriptional regulator
MSHVEAKSDLAASTQAAPLPADERRRLRGMRDDGTPYYVQLASVIRRQIDDQVLKAGDQLPTLKEFVAAFGVSPMTVRQAIASLEKDGLVAATRGRGTFVTASPADQRPGPYQLTATPAGRIDQLTFKVLASHPSRGELALSSDDGQALSEYHYMKRLFLRGGKPFTIGEFLVGARIHAAVPEKAWRTELVSTLLYDTRAAGLRNVRQTFRVMASTPSEATELGIRLNDPVVRVRRIFLNGRKEVICLGQLVYRTDGVVFDIHFDFKKREQLFELGGFPEP